MTLKIRGINHIGLAPKDPAQAKAFFEDVLGLRFRGEELVEEQATNTMIFESGQGVVGLLEILENQAGKTGPIATFLEKKGSGIHHLALTVDNVKDAITYLTEQGIPLINEEPKPGVCNTQITFIHPKATGGLLVELVEENSN